MKHFFLFLLLFNSFLFFSQRTEPNENQQNLEYYPTELNGKWYFSNQIDSITESTVFYDTIHFCSYEYSSNHYIAIKGNDFQFFDHKLHSIFSGKVSTFVLTENNVFIKWQKDWVRYNFKSNLTSTFKADSIFNSNEITYIYSENKVGVAIENIFVPPLYYRIIPFKDSKNNYGSPLLLTLEKGKYGLLDYNGKTILEPIASIIQYEDFGIIKYKESNWKYLFPDRRVVDPKSFEIHFYSNKMYKIYNKERTKGYLYVDHKISPSTSQYDDIFPSDDLSYFTVRQNNKIGLINYSYHLVKPPFCDQLEPIKAVHKASSDENDNDKLLKYLIGENWGVMDMKGTIITKANYHNVLEVLKINNSLYFKVAMNGKIGVVDKNEKVIIPFEYQNLLYSGNGFIVKKGEKYGYLDLHATQIVENEYESFLCENSVDEEENEIIVFINRNGYIFVNCTPKQLLPDPCNEYQYWNNVLKCYYPNRIDVHLLEKGVIVETTSYPSIQSVEFENSDKYRDHLGGFPKTTLELNQLTGLYGARFTLLGGLDLDPTYTHYRSSIFNDWFYAGEIKDTNIAFTFNSFPSLRSYDVFNWLNCSNGNFYSDLIFGTEILAPSFYSSGSDDNYIFTANNPIKWITNGSKDKSDPLINKIGLLYHEKLNSSYQKVNIGGTLKIVPLAKSDISLMDYFNFLNAGKNLWFQDLEQAKIIMNPNLGVKFTDSKLAIRDMRDYNRVEFKYDVDQLIPSNMWTFWTFQKKGEKSWNITNDLNFKKEILENCVSIETTTNQFQDFIIIEKRIGSKNKKGIYSTDLKPITDIIYDDIIYAGSLGFLVRLDHQYFYINESGENIKK